MKKILPVVLLLCLSLPLQAADRLIVQFSDLQRQKTLKLPTISLVHEQKNVPGVAILQWNESVGRQQQLQDMRYLRELEGINWLERDEKTVSVQFEAGDSQLLEQQRIWHEPHALYEAWESSDDCSEVVVAVLDSGLHVQHESIAGNVHINPGEIHGSQQDNDGNGYIGDYYGWNAIAGNGDVSDLYGHGTHVAGIIGAAGNAVGVCRQVDILPVKFLDRFGNGSIADAVKAIYYVLAIQQQFPDKRYIINNSWAASFNSALVSAIEDATAAGMLVVNAAGNNGQNIDIRPGWPAAMAGRDFANVTVANLDTRQLDNHYDLHERSSYGLQSVTVAAAGTDIMSLWLNNQYREQSGTSMATPIVSGIAAMLWTQNPDMTAREIRAVLESSIDKHDALFARIKNHGLVNAVSAIENGTQKKPVAGFIRQDQSRVFVEGAYLDQLQTLRINEQPLSYIVHDDTRLQINNPEYLRCGYLYLQGGQGLESQLYINWYPRAPQLISLEQTDNGLAILTWQSDPSIDRIQIEVADSSGVFEQMAEVENNPQSAEIVMPDQDSRMRIRGESHCLDVYSQANSRFSNYSTVLNVSDLTAPVWHTTAISNAVKNRYYKVQIEAGDADYYELEPFSSEECLPDGLQLSADGVISGIPKEEANCEFQVAAVNALGNKRTLQSFTLPAYETIQPENRLYQGDQWLLEFRAEDAAVYGMTLEQKQQQWTVNWWQPMDQDAYEMQLGVAADQALASASWIREDGSLSAVSGNIRLSHAGFLVFNNTAHAQNDQENERSFRMQFSALPLNQLQVSATGGDRRCFVATAVYQDNNAVQVQVLRQLRDSALQQWPAIAEPLVEWYYRHSPGWVGAVENRPALAHFIRRVLRPMLDGLAASYDATAIK